MGTITVINASTSTISVLVSAFSNPNGSLAWFTLAPGARDTWSRAGWELVAFRNAKDTNRSGIYVADESTVTFTGLAHISVV